MLEQFSQNCGHLPELGSCRSPQPLSFRMFVRAFAVGKTADQIITRRQQLSLWFIDVDVDMDVTRSGPPSESASVLSDVDLVLDVASRAAGIV